MVKVNKKYREIASKTPVLFITYNRLEYTKLSLNKLLESNCGQIIVFDNNSTDGTREWLSQKNNPKLDIYYNDKNLGVSGAMNYFFSRTEKDTFVAKVDNDTLVNPDWLELLIEAAEVSGLDLVQAKHPILKISHESGSFDTWMKSLKKDKINNHVFFSDHIGGSGIVVRRAKVDNFENSSWVLGGWDDYQRKNPDLRKGFCTSTKVELLDTENGVTKTDGYLNYYIETGRVKRGNHDWIYASQDLGNNKEASLLEEKSAWWGHHFFAYDLIINQKPKVIVELGSHWGFSFFVFCQAVKDAKLNTKLHAIDSWEGDSQAGYYGEEVYKSFTSNLDKRFKHLDTSVHRGYFESYLDSFKDGSIDILHIDGLHTYDAVKKDLEGWLPKMSKNGIILFHDIAVVKGDFGVYKLWSELKNKYDSFEFNHSHGLGVLYIGKPLALDESHLYYYQRKYEDALITQINDDAARISDLKNNIENADILNRQLLSEVENLKNTIANVHKSRVWKLRNKIAGLLGKERF